LAGFLELAVDRHVQVVDDREAIFQVRQETSQHEIERAVAERFQRHPRRRIVENDFRGLLLFSAMARKEISVRASVVRCFGVPRLPASPREQMTKWAERPARVSRTTTPPQPNSTSSGWAPNARIQAPERGLRE